MNSNPTISEASRPAYKKWLLIGIIWLIVGFVLLEVIPIVNNNSFLPGEKVYDVTGDWDIRTINGDEYIVFLTEKKVEKRKIPNVSGKAVPKGEYRCTVLSGDAFLIENGEIIKNTIYKVEEIDYKSKVLDTNTGEDISSYVEGISTISSGNGPTVWKFKKDASQYAHEDLWVVVQGDYHWLFEQKTLVQYYKSNELLLCNNNSSKLTTSYRDNVYKHETYGYTVVERANTRLSLARTFGNPEEMLAFTSLLVLLVFFIPLFRIHKLFTRNHEEYVLDLADAGNVSALKKHLSRIELGRTIAKILGILLFGLYILMIVIAIFFYNDKSFYGETSNVINQTLSLENGMQIIKLQPHANNFLYSILYHFPVLNGDMTDYVHTIMSLPSMALVGALCLYPNIMLKSMRRSTKKELSRSSLRGRR